MQPEVERLMRSGGWELDDVQARHAEHPDTFWLPLPEEVARLRPGSAARLIFRVVDQADPAMGDGPAYEPSGRPNLVVGHERMWVWVEAVDADGYVGVLQNQPLATHTRLVLGARVRFTAADPIDLEVDPPVDMGGELEAMAAMGFPALDLVEALRPEDPGRPPTIPPSWREVCARHGARPERPTPFARCLVAADVDEGTWPIYGARFPPRPDRQDTGWILWANQPDMEQASADVGMDVVDIGSVRARHERAWRHLALPPGWAFVLGPDHEDVYQDAALLEQ